MKSMIQKTTLLIAGLFLFAVSGYAQEHGQHRGGQMGGMHGDRGADMNTIHAMFAANKSIKRSVKNIENGVEAVTESDDPKIAALIKEHTHAMKARLEKKQPIRMWDPLFAALFENADKIRLEVTDTARGVKITETSTDAYVVKLIQSHAVGVTEFVKEGMPSMPRRHELPDQPEKSGTAFMGKGDGITTCPVTGEPIDKSISAKIDGRTVYFCCPGCRDTVVKDPSRYLKME